jgi:peptidylprolyl isomerase
MKSMFQFIAVAVCAAALAACGGGKDKDAVVVTPQPDYLLNETVVGSGAAVAAAGDTVVIKYNGFLYDATTKTRGTKVMSTYDTNTTYTFTLGVGAAVAGWDQALLGMRAGGSRNVILPASLAFGAAGRAAVNVGGIDYPVIPANSPMAFDFEMVNVTKAVIIPSTAITEVQVGTGAEATTGKTASVKYTGWLYDATAANGKGKQFDSNASATTTLDVVVDANPLQVISGFNIGIKGMKVGGKRTIVIPSYQGYGVTVKYDSTGAVSIPANSVLVFDIELISVK